MKKIGFIDYYLSEWHAWNYPAWIKAASERLGVEFEVAYAWGEIDKSPVDGATSEEWCKKYGVEQCSTAEELCEKSDYILILAPSNPETHLRLAEKVLPYGKNTYIDKTFAPDYATAEKIFALAKKYGTKFFSSSALRYSTELTPYVGKATQMFTTGGGSRFEEYIIHQTEMIVKTLGVGAKRVRARNIGDFVTVEIGYGDDRVATMNFAPPFGFSFSAGELGNTSILIPVVSDTFGGLIEDILRFYTSGKVPFDSAETLEVMKIREAAVKAAKSGMDGWTDL